MAYIYLIVPEQSKVGGVTDALIHEGVDAPQIRVFSMRPDRLPKLAVRTVRYRSQAANATFGALTGGAVGLLIGLLLVTLVGLGLVVVPLLLFVFAVGGTLSRWWFDDGLARELYRLDGAMRRGSQVMVLEVDKERIGDIKNGIAQRHPELAVLGEDAQGIPPFP